MVESPSEDHGERERQHGMLDFAIGVTGTALLFAVFLLWPLATPAAAGAAWLRDTVACAAAGESEALLDRR